MPQPRADDDAGAEHARRCRDNRSARHHRRTRSASLRAGRSRRRRAAFSLHIVGIRGETREEIERFPAHLDQVGRDRQAVRCPRRAMAAATRHHRRRRPARFRQDALRFRCDPQSALHRRAWATAATTMCCRAIVRFFEGKGYRVHGADDVAPELLAGEGPLGDKAPSAEDRADIDIAFRGGARPRTVRRGASRRGGQRPCSRRGSRRGHRRDAAPLRRAPPVGREQRRSGRRRAGQGAQAGPGETASTCRPSAPRR